MVNSEFEVVPSIFFGNFLFLVKSDEKKGGFRRAMGDLKKHGCRSYSNWARFCLSIVTSCARGFNMAVLEEKRPSNILGILCYSKEQCMGPVHQKLGSVLYLDRKLIFRYLMR